MQSRCAVAIVVWMLLAWMLVACDRAEAPATRAADCPVGSAGCACTAGGGCDPTLLCGAGTCQQLIPIEMPRALTGGELPTMIVLRCAGAGRVVVNGQEMDHAKARNVITDELRKVRDLQGVVQCSLESPTGEMIALIDLLRETGVRKYALATEGGGGLVPPPEPEPPR